MTTYLYSEDCIKEQLNELTKEVRSLSFWKDLDLEYELQCKIQEILEECEDRYETIKDIKAAGYGKYLPLYLQ